MNAAQLSQQSISELRTWDLHVCNISNIQLFWSECDYISFIFVDIVFFYLLRDEKMIPDLKLKINFAHKVPTNIMPLALYGSKSEWEHSELKNFWKLFIVRFQHVIYRFVQKTVLFKIPQSPAIKEPTVNVYTHSNWQYQQNVKSVSGIILSHWQQQASYLTFSASKW